jgi:chaperonin cofactor prefoldin
MSLTMQQATTVKVPQTRAEFEAMATRRGELQSQLRQAEDRRMVLSEQVARSSSDVRAPVAQRLEQLDQRITLLERQITQLDDAISAAMTRPEVVQTQPSEQGLMPIPPIPPIPAIPPIPPIQMDQSHFTTQEPHFMVGARDIVVGGILGGGLLLLVGFIAWRYAVRRLSTMVGTASDAGHMTRLQQSVDAIAVEVERISENQRYLTKALHGGAAQPVESRARVAEHVPPSGSRGL